MQFNTCFPSTNRIWNYSLLSYQPMVVHKKPFLGSFHRLNSQFPFMTSSFLIFHCYTICTLSMASLGFSCLRDTFIPSKTLPPWSYTWPSLLPTQCSTLGVSATNLACADSVETLPRRFYLSDPGFFLIKAIIQLQMASIHCSSKIKLLLQRFWPHVNHIQLCTSSWLISFSELYPNESPWPSLSTPFLQHCRFNPTLTFHASTSHRFLLCYI